MEKLFNEYNINLDEKQKKQFKEYYNLLKEYNNRFNLTAITEEREVYIKHFIDSVLSVELLKENSLIDIGSGGGFPALPIKIVKPEMAVTMVEATEKKCGFLNEVIKQINLDNTAVVYGRAEELAYNKEFREKFDNCTARAVARLNILAEYCLPFVKVGGIFIAYKGSAEEELKQSQNAIKKLGGKVIECKKYMLDGAERCLIVIQKEKKTDNIYPRSNAKIKGKPL